MIELKENGMRGQKDQDFMEMKQREKEASLLDNLERENKVNFKNRNNDMISKCLEEQNVIHGKAREMKKLEEDEFQKKLREMKEQETLAKQQQREYKDMVTRDMHENYEISKKVSLLTDTDQRY